MIRRKIIHKKIIIIKMSECLSRYKCYIDLNNWRDLYLTANNSDGFDKTQQKHDKL